MVSADGALRCLLRGSGFRGDRRGHRV